MDLFEMARRTTRNDHARAAGTWALGILHDVLGPDWPTHHHRANGHLPAFLLNATTHPVAFQEQLELAARLATLGDRPGFAKVRRELRTDITPTRTLHTQLQLELGDLGAAIGAPVGFEHGTGAPADVTVGDLTFEAVVVTADVGFRDDRTYSEKLTGRLWHVRATYNVDIDGTFPDRLDDDATARWLDAVEHAARQVSTSGEPTVVQIGPASVTISPAGTGGPGRFEGPTMIGAGWERTAARLRGKAEQAARSGARWLRVDLRDGTFGFSPWYQQPLDQRSDSLAAAVRTTLDGSALDGVAVSSGALDTFRGLDVGSHTHPNGHQAHVHWIGPARARELYTVALTDRGRTDTQTVVDMYGQEPSRLDEHLGVHGFEPVAVLLA